MPAPSLMGHASWPAYAQRLLECADDHERLAICAAALSEREQVVRAQLGPRFRDVIDSQDREQSGADLAASVVSAQTDDDAAVALVSAVVALDRSLATADDEEGRVCSSWGPWMGFADGTEVRLVRWPRPAALPAGRQSLLSRALAHHRIVGPGAGGFEWDIAPIGENLPQGRRDVLRRLFGRGGWPIKVVLWRGLTFVDADAARSTDDCFVVGASDANRVAEILADVDSAISHASVTNAHILLFPELYVPEDQLQHVQRRLSQADAAFPALTVVGLGHRATDSGWANEAVVLDYAGDEVWRHRKTAEFEVAGGRSECLAVGGFSTLRGTPSGWLMVMICLDLFASPSGDVIKQVAPNLVVAPSLSRSTTPHRTAARTLRALGVATGVANRPLTATDQAPSFMVAPTQDEEESDDTLNAEWRPHD